MELPFEYIVLSIYRIFDDRDMPLVINKGTLNKYIAKYENQQQLTYNSNTPYDKASKQLDESIVLGMNIDLQA